MMQGDVAAKVTVRGFPGPHVPVLTREVTHVSKPFPSRVIQAV